MTNNMMHVYRGGYWEAKYRGWTGVEFPDHKGAIAPLYIGSWWLASIAPIHLQKTMFTVINVVCLLKRMCMPSVVLIGYCVTKLHGHLCPYHNVLPEAVYCCFTRTTLFTNM